MAPVRKAPSHSSIGCACIAPEIDALLRSIGCHGRKCDRDKALVWCTGSIPATCRFTHVAGYDARHNGPFLRGVGVP